ncbi:MAG: hypothetical protein RMJ66_00610 [Bacteroidia bacterium]|nr:hypothetical protein [Bacteroidia bacterium]MDW8133546.1 hypothetical protein [Bacteroidia bacterium]
MEVIANRISVLGLSFLREEASGKIAKIILEEYISFLSGRFLG